MFLTKLPNHNFNINFDSDGILSYLLLKKIFKDSELNGYTNSEKFIWSGHNTLNETYNDIFVDIFISKKNVVCIDQHIISRKEKDLKEYRKSKINPHIWIEEHHAMNNTYYTKFPFQTFLFILALFERESEFGTTIDDINFEGKIPSIGENIAFYDLILRADGVLENFVKYKNNVKEWSRKLIDFSFNGKNTTKILDYLLNLSDEEALEKSQKVSDFYISHKLKKDGGYNSSFDFETNLKTINLFMRSYAKFMNVDLMKKEKTLYQFIGNTHIFDENTINYIDLNELDTFAFISNKKLSCTTDLKLNEIKNNVIMYC